MSGFNKIEDLDIRDISKITEVESHIKSLESKLLLYEPVLEKLTDGIEICDEKGNILYANKKFFEMTGFAREERLSRNIFEVNPDGLLPQVLLKKEPIHDAITTAPGMEGRGLANAYPIIQEEQLIGAVLFAKDVTQAIQLSKKLNEREAYLTELYRRTTKYFFTDIISNNKKMKESVFLARQMARNDYPVVLIGESGTGKDVLAQAIHTASTRYRQPFIKFNCAQFSEEASNLELFGYDKNSFPEANTDKLGLLELTNGGTIYLENLQELSISIQSKLLKSLKKQKVYRVGAWSSIPINVRLIVSLNQSIENSKNHGLISEDLSQYLRNYCIFLPLLKERKEDIADLVHLFINQTSKITGKHVKGITPEALELLKKYNWPGNVSELKMLVKMIILTLEKGVITFDQVLSMLPTNFKEKIENTIMPLEEVEKVAIQNALKIYGDTLSGKKQIADTLQISLGTLYNKLKKYDISN